MTARIEMIRACKAAEALLTGNDLAQEVLYDYTSDALAGLVTEERLRGFFHGLYVGGVIKIEDYDDLDRMMIAERSTTVVTCKLDSVV